MQDAQEEADLNRRRVLEERVESRGALSLREDAEPWEQSDNVTLSASVSHSHCSMAPSSSVKFWSVLAAAISSCKGHQHALIGKKECAHKSGLPGGEVLEPLVNLLSLGRTGRVAVVAVSGRKELGRRPASTADGAALLRGAGRQAVAAAGKTTKAHRHRGRHMTRLGHARGW